MKRITNTLAIGVDVIKISRFGDMIKKHGPLNSPFVDRLTARILHNTHELPAFKGLVERNKRLDSFRYLAGAWAMKEAIYKTLNEEDQAKFQFKQWFKLYDERGKPTICNDFYDKDEEFLLSISHDHDTLVASVIRQEVGYIRDQ